MRKTITLAVLALIAATAGCVSQSAAPTGAPINGAHAAPQPPPGENWSGTVYVAGPGLTGLIVSTDAHYFNATAAHTWALNIVLNGDPSIGSIRVVVEDSNGKIVLANDSAPPVTVSGLLPADGQYDAYLQTGNDTTLTANWAYTATLTWRGFG